MSEPTEHPIGRLQVLPTPPRKTPMMVPNDCERRRPHTHMDTWSNNRDGFAASKWSMKYALSHSIFFLIGAVARAR